MAIERIIQPTTTRPIVDENGLQSQEMRSWTQIITNQALIITTGSPETVIAAVQGAVCMDETLLATPVLYIKQSGDIGGDKTKGWIGIGP